MLGFLSPFWLLLSVPVGATLWYAYILKGRGERKIIPSVLLVRTLSRRSTQRSRIVLPLRFFLESLFLFLLICLLAGPTISSSGKNVAVILDDSQSTAGRIRNATAFELLKEKATDYLSDLPSGSKVRMWTASGRSVGSEVWTVNEAIAQLTSLAPASVYDKLPDLIDSVDGAGIQEIAVFTEKQIEGEIPRNVKIKRPEGAQEAKQNIGIADVHVHPSGESTKLIVDIRAFIARPTAVTVSVVPLDDRGRREDPIHEEALYLNESAQVTSSLSVRANDIQRFVVKLSFPPGAFDFLPLDNEWFGTMVGGGTTIRVVSDLSASDLRTGAIGGYTFEVIKPLDYQTESGDTAPLVFHRFVPQTAPSVATLYVMPTGTNEDLVDVQRVNAPSLTRWNLGSPLLAYLNVRLLSPKEATIMKGAPFQETVVSTEEGALLVAGESRGRRVAAVGFELFPFEGKASPIVSVLTLNTLKWLMAKGTPGVPPLPSTGQGVVIENSDGQRFTDIQGAPRGLYRWVASEGRKDSVAEQWVPLNFFDNRESDPGHTVTLSKISASMKDMNLERASELLWFVWILVGILLFDLGYILLRRSTFGL